ncbi:MAG: NADH-quinone oxidoreductase subunit H [Desulfurococcaceae archaeon]
MEFIPAVFAAAAPLIAIVYDGLERKLRAALQSRIGPPLLQTLYDVAKLVGKSSAHPPAARAIAFLLSTSVVLQAIALYYVLSLVGSGDLLGGAPVVIVLMLASQSALSIVPFLVPSPFAQIGGAREVLLSLVNETALVASLSIFAFAHSSTATWWAARSLALSTALAAIALSTYAMGGRAPFDLPEAEPELASGILVEFGGWTLALALCANFTRRLLLELVAASAALLAWVGPGPTTTIAVLVASPAVRALYATSSAILGRTRIDVGIASLSRAYLILLALSVAGLFLGVLHG